MNKDTSWYHRFRLWLGDTHVEEDELLPLLRKGRVHAFRGPGYHHKARFWHSYGKPVSTALCFANLEQVPVNTTDKLLVLVDATIGYRFDPGQCQEDNLASVLNSYSRDSLVKAIAHKVIRQVCEQYLEEKLAGGRTRHHLELQIGNHLKQKLAPFGMVLREGTAVDITRITPPAVAKARIEAQCHAIYTASARQQPHAISQQLHQQTLAQNSEHLNLTIIQSAENVSATQQDMMPVINLTPSPHQNGHAKGRSMVRH